MGADSKGKPPTTTTGTTTTGSTKESGASASSTSTPPPQKRGRPFEPGNPGGPGRPRLPDFMKKGGKSADVLRELEKAACRAKGHALEKDADWLRAVTLYLEYTVGPAKNARHATDLPESNEERIKLLEEVVLEAALAGNAADAAVRMLEALDPTRWGKRPSEGETDDQVDTVDWTPLVRSGSTNVA